MMLKLHCDNCDTSVNEDEITQEWVIISTLGRDLEAHNIDCAHALLDRVQAEHDQAEQRKTELFQMYRDHISLRIPPRSTEPTTFDESLTDHTSDTLLTRGVERGGPYKQEIGIWSEEPHP